MSEINKKNEPIDKLDLSKLNINPCWRKIGITGDRSCPELAQYIHCRNCPVFAGAGRALLNRSKASGQIQEWTKQIAQERTVNKSDTLSVGIFRLADEWLALPTVVYSEVVNDCKVRRLEHGRDGILLGLCSVRGELQLCVSLEKLLGMECRGYQGRSRFCVLNDNGSKWIFPTDQVSGIVRIERAEIEETPVSAEMGLTLFSTGIFNHDGKKIGLLSEDLVFHALSRSMQ